MRIRVWVGILAGLLVCTPAGAQTGAAETIRPPLRVYLDCGSGGCFQEYLRDEIDFVDFVQQPQDADIHLLSSSQETGGGGREVVLRFVGRGRFAGVDKELRAVSVSGDTESTRRDIVLRTVVVGLLDYLAREGLPADIEVAVETGGGDRQQTRPEDDPWNAWVFSLRGSASVDAEESSRQHDWDARFSADRVTGTWKLTFGCQWQEDTEKYDLDEDVPFSVTTQRRNASAFAAKSAGPHWSFGLLGEIASSTFGNTKFSTDVAPAVEFNVFPYADYARRQLRLQYFVGLAHAAYNEITLFGKLKETNPQQQFSVDLEQEEPWGSVQLGLEWSQFLHDLGKYRLQFDGEVSVRVTRGLSFTVEAGASRVRDQLSLPRRGATQEEVLLKLRELQSGFRFQLDVGLTYRFGSLFNNVVNPRFGR